MFTHDGGKTVYELWRVKRWSRNATVGDLWKLPAEMKDKPYISSLDWIASGAFVDRGQPDDTPLFPRSATVKPAKDDDPE